MENSNHYQFPFLFFFKHCIRNYNKNLLFVSQHPKSELDRQNPRCPAFQAERKYSCADFKHVSAWLCQFEAIWIYLPQKEKIPVCSDTWGSQQATEYMGKVEKKPNKSAAIEVWLFGDAYEFINSYTVEILISKRSITLDQFPLDISTLDHCPQRLFEGVTFPTAFWMVCLKRATHPTPNNRDCAEGKLTKFRNLLFLFTILTESGKKVNFLSSPHPVYSLIYQKNY